MFMSEQGHSSHTSESGAILIEMGATNNDAAVISPDGQHYKSTSDVHAARVVGSSDVLAGVVAGLMAQKMEATTSALWGVHILGLAVEAASKDMGEEGIIASDLIHRLPNVLRYVRRSPSLRKDTAPAGLRRTM